MKNRKIQVALLLLLGCFFFSNEASADVMPGIRVGVYTDPNDFFVGGELLFTITPDWYFNPNVEYVFVDNARFLTINFDVHYDFEVDAPVYFWVGGGAAILYFDPESRFADSETDAGLNLFVGVGFNKGGRIIPYIQPKIILADDSEFALAFGVRF